MIERSWEPEVRENAVTDADVHMRERTIMSIVAVGRMAGNPARNALIWGVPASPLFPRRNRRLSVSVSMALTSIILLKLTWPTVKLGNGSGALV